eukprot:g25600.t1
MQHCRLRGDVISHAAVVSVCERARQWEPTLRSLHALPAGPWDETIARLVARWDAWRGLEEVQWALARPLPHPCPRKLHHPGEGCGCARRLDLLVPHGHSRMADRGSVHSARLQNLRWRLTSPALRRRFPSSEKVRNSLPLCLRALAVDHKGDAACKTLRPLSPDRKLRRSVMSGAKRVSSPDCCYATPQREESPEVIDFDPPSTSKAPRPPRVTFNEELNSVVPVIAARAVWWHRGPIGTCRGAAWPQALQILQLLLDHKTYGAAAFACSSAVWETSLALLAGVMELASVKTTGFRRQTQRSRENFSDLRMAAEVRRMEVGIEMRNAAFMGCAALAMWQHAIAGLSEPSVGAAQWKLAIEIMCMMSLTRLRPSAASHRALCESCRGHWQHALTTHHAPVWAHEKGGQHRVVAQMLEDIQEDAVTRWTGRRKRGQ